MTILSGPSVGLAGAHGGLEVHAIRVSSGLGNVAGIRAGGEVLTVHRRALNLWLGGRLVAVVAGSANPFLADGGAAADGRELGPVTCPPFGLVISSGLDLGSFGLRAGMPCRLADGWLRIGHGHLSIRLLGARVWSPRLYPLLARPEDQALLAARAELAREFVAAQGPGGLHGDWAAQATGPLEALAQSLVDDDLPAAEAAGADLIGLGAGLTPSGDDLLIGFSAALVAAGDASGPRLAGSWARSALRRTTPVALAFHRHAAQSAYDEGVHALLGAALLGNRSDLQLSVRRTAAWGATSGRDLLAGMVLGLEAAAARSRWVA